jgi:hypothetical protein
VRVAALLALAGALAGLLLIVAGLADLHWWSTPAAGQLTRLMERIRVDLGATPPALLRGGGPAVELIAIGTACLAYAILAPLIVKGRRWARTWGLALGIATFLIGLAEIGADATQPLDLNAYLHGLANAGASDLIPQVTALVNPAWYGWLEDIAQGVQVLVSFATILALAGAAVWHPDFFTAGKATPQAPDEWTAAISRIREQNATPPLPEPSQDDAAPGSGGPPTEPGSRGASARPGASSSKEPAYDTSMYRRPPTDDRHEQ